MTVWRTARRSFVSAAVCFWVDAHALCSSSNRLALQYIRDKAADTKPFFMFFSTTTPHSGNLKGNSSSCKRGRGRAHALWVFA